MTDLTPNDLSHLSDEEFMALCPQGEHAPGPEPLSPAAEAVLDAFRTSRTGQRCLAAALRAAVDQVEHHWDGMECDMYYWIIRDPSNRVYVGATSHGRFYEAEPDELTHQINELNSYIEATQQALSMFKVKGEEVV